MNEYHTTLKLITQLGLMLMLGSSLSGCATPTVGQQFRDHAGPGRDTIMSGTLQGMSDRELEDLAHYFAVSRP